MPWMRDPIKGKGAAMPMVPTGVLLGENPDTAFTPQMQKEEQMAEAVWKVEDPESLHAAQMLAVSEEERLSMDMATMAIVEDKRPISKRMKKKR